MMDKLWVVFLVALTGAHLGFGSPVRSTPNSYPHDQNGPILEGWTEGSLYAAVPALALVVTAAVLLIGCTWCYRNKDCKQNEGADNQLFTASATHLHERRSHPPDSGFSEPANNNISEDNNNGPISLREMQNIANNNAAAYIVSENEERNRVSRESVVEFEPLPTGIRVADPLERCVDWFGDEDFPRNRLQYLREIGRGWFGRVVEGEIEDDGSTTTVAVKILNQNASLEDKARFLGEARLYRDSRHENVLGFVASCLLEDPWILIFELCSSDLQSYLSSHRPQMEALDAAGVPLRLMCDVTGALVYLHSRGISYGELCTSNVLVRGEGVDARAALGHYGLEPRPAVPAPPTIENDVHALGTLMWDICAWGAPAPDLACRYRDHLYQVMQLCWIAEPTERPSAAQIHALLNHLLSTHARSQETSRDDGYGSSDFEDRWQRLKPNTIPKLDEHVAIVHAPSTSSHFTDFEHTPTSLSVELDSAVSRSSSIVSDKHLLRTKSASLNNLHGSLEDFRAGSESETLEDKEQDRSDASVDPWLKDIIAGSQDDANYYRVVSDVIKNLDNILNSEKTSSSESSHQASPSRDNLSLDCKKDYPMQSSMVKSPGISNFQNILEAGLEDKSPEKRNEYEDRDTIGTLSHSFERHSDTTSQATLENLTPDTPIKDMELPIEETNNDIKDKLDRVEIEVVVDVELPKENKIDNSDSVLPNLTDIFIAPTSSVNEPNSVVNVSEDCQSPGDNKLNVIMRDKESVEAKSISEVIKEPIKSECVEEVIAKSVCSLEQYSAPVNVQSREILPEVTGNDDTKNLLPSAALPENNVAELRPEPISTCSSQNEINNDLITPAESTTDRKSTNVESVSHQTETLDSNVNHLDNVSEISIKPTPSLIETEERKMPVSTGTNEVILPEAVQNESTHIVRFIAHDKGDESVIQNNLEINSVSDSVPEVSNFGVLASNCTEEELNFQSKDNTKQGDFNIKLTTPTLVLTDSQDEVISAISIDKVSEAFVEKIIKEAETAALLETVHAKVMEPITDNKKNDKPVNDFLENEIKFLERSSVNEFALIPQVFSDKPVQSKASDSLSMFLKEEIIESPKEAVNESEVEDIAKKILSDAMQDVPKVIEKTDAHFFLKGDIVKDATGRPDSRLEIQTTEKPESIQENLESTESPILQKENDIKLLDQVLITVPVLPQSSLDLDSTASADSSQSTFLIRNTLKEESNSALPEEHKQLRNELAHPQINSESISNTLSEIDTNTMESTLDVQTPKLLPQEQNLHSADTIITSNVAESITEVTVPNLESGMETMTSEQSNSSTAYLDLTNGLATGILELSPMEEEMQKVVNSCLETTDIESDDILVKNESTVYLDLPNVIRKTDEFLQFERQLNSNMDVRDPLSSSTPKNSTDNSQNSEHDNFEPLSETKVPDHGPGVTLTKLEQQCVPDFMSPFDSPSKSHPTDTYDENSSVVLGPFENCTIELFKSVKSTDLMDIPKEELFAFSSNFSEFDLETPSPLRDGNFLNEVPDIINDDDLDGVEPKDFTDPKTDVSDATDQSVTERRVSPSTPPNSPGYFLASTSQHKYLVDIDLNQPTELPAEPDSGLSSLHKEIELNQIELQITSKLAMAENENNLNIEYSGPLTVEGVVLDEMQQEEESGPEMLLAGNGEESIDDIRNRFALDEDCVTALRNELELKLPLAQVAAIEPACEADKDDSWSESLPPPPELVVSYPGALSPIAEETAPQLSAYENDAPYIASARTESSESYPEPCNNSTDDASELPTAAHTYTLSRPPAEPSASEAMTMSVDSLNESPKKDTIDDRTFTLEDEKDACERLSQVSPFILSPTDASAPQSDVTGVSTLSHTTVPKTSKPSETHCLSKATSIDSWCSNDTLYNVEEAFDDLASDPELPTDECEPNVEQNLEHSDSTHTLTDKVPSHVSTYIVHDSQSDDDRFSPDSITAHDAHTYTKPRTDLDTSPSVLTKSEINDSKTQTKDLAYGTLMSGVPSYSNCTTEVLSTDNGWLFPHPELVRRSPVETAEITAAIPSEREVETEQKIEPQLKKEPRLNKMESVEISCLEDHLNFSPKNQTVDNDSPHHYNMAGTTTSTPLAVIPADESAEYVEVTPVQLRTPVDLPDSLPNFPSFFFSAGLRPQNDSNAKYSPSLEDSANPAVGSYTEFRNAAIFKPQDTRMQSSQSDSDSYRQFESSVLNRPQETTITPSSLLLMSERAVVEFTQPSQLRNEPTVSKIPPSYTNLRESHVDKVETVIITDLEEDETEQPHSIIIAEISKDNRTFESHNEGEMNHTYDSHPSRRKKEDAIKENNSDNSKELTVNGLDDQSSNTENLDAKSPETSKAGETQSASNTNKTDAPKDSVSNLVFDVLDIKCNGNDEKFATVNFINESFEELLESNVDDSDCKDKTNDDTPETSKDDKIVPLKETTETMGNPEVSHETSVNGVEDKVAAVTEDFLQNEKKFCELDAYLPLLSDIRFTGPASEIMTTSFSQESPTDPEGGDKADVKEWDSDTDSHSTNSSSGEFIWKGGDGQETSVVPSTHFDHRGGGGAPVERSASASGSGSGSGSGSEGDEVEFVPSSWDCRAEPAKSSLRRLVDNSQDKKRVVFKRQKYHCVYEYPRELATVDADSPAYLPDLSTYADWEPASAEEAELGYGQLFGAPSPLDLYPLRGGFGADYDEDFFISSSARPFESLGALTTTSQFFPGRLKPASPPARAADLATPDSGVEDSTPADPDDYTLQKLPDLEPWRAPDSASSSESASPGSPEALGGLRHTRDKLKLDLPPSPHIPSPRHNRVFNFVLDKPKRPPTTPLVMTDETPLVTTPISICAQDDPIPEPTFSTFGKTTQKTDPEQKMILTDEAQTEEKPPSPVKVEPVKGEGTVLDSGDEDSGIESSSKATLERNASVTKLEP